MGLSDQLPKLLAYLGTTPLIKAEIRWNFMETEIGDLERVKEIKKKWYMPPDQCGCWLSPPTEAGS